MKMTYKAVKQQTIALAEGNGNIFCLTIPAYNTVFWKPRRVSRPPCDRKQYYKLMLSLINKFSRESSCPCGTPEIMKMTHAAVKQQTTALAEGDGNIFCLTTPVCNAVFWKPRRVSRPPCEQKTALHTGVVFYK
ncbi:MAG: hypothetical protein A2096_10320 [Spirochaetes bacterium GWF1_41_5]|nr:MAG: hypothetical protein A2096_10320 [Spirochaetes bacterium GWF1_41_5]